MRIANNICAKTPIQVSLTWVEIGDLARIWGKGHELDNNQNSDEICDEELNKRPDELVTYANHPPLAGGSSIFA